MERLNLKPTHKSVQNYYEALRQFKTIDVSHEGAVRSAFQNLLEHCGRQFGWKLVPEWPIKRDRAHSLRIDGALVDEYRLTHGFWEAKDSHDDLAKEVKKKLTAGYPQNNIIFQAPERAILWQNGRVVLDEDITEPVVLVEILKQFFDHTPPELKDWDDAVAHFQNQVPELGQALKETENTARVERQKQSPIKVIIGNPPYNVGQLNENDNNKNRKYKVMDKRVAETYAKDSRATNKNALSDPYVKAIRWASDRIGPEGIVAFVSNNSFIENLAFDGMREHLEKDFDAIYVLDLGGNVRKNPKLSGTTHNVFGIQVGVSINIFVRKRAAA